FDHRLDRRIELLGEQADGHALVGGEIPLPAEVVVPYAGDRKLRIADDLVARDRVDEGRRRELAEVGAGDGLRITQTELHVVFVQDPRAGEHWKQVVAFQRAHDRRRRVQIVGADVLQRLLAAHAGQQAPALAEFHVRFQVVRVQRLRGAVVVGRTRGLAQLIAARVDDFRREDLFQPGAA